MPRTRRPLVLLVAGLLLLSLSVVAANQGRDARRATDRPELAYLKEVNAWRPSQDPQLLFMLMSQYANAGRHLEGAAYLDALRRRSSSERARYRVFQQNPCVADIRTGNVTIVQARADAAAALRQKPVTSGA